ncbi:MAG: hypothetical protein GF384_04445 [Elusimicrobia bacterium]|nr:hypothetical protein [Elusimicrobiota bacterium]MBD3412099.1 hypothetical protein [Elusimicrobiota bacterium]
MKRLFLCVILVVSVMMFESMVMQNIAADLQSIQRTIKQLRQLHMPLPAPGPSDWLANHYEGGQTFKQYIKSRPVKPTFDRNVIYIQPLGNFIGRKKEIISITAEFIRAYFGLPVRVRKPVDITDLPHRAQRRHPTWGIEQVSTTYILKDILKPKRPDNAIAYLALTNKDLFAGKNNNFVFGQAFIRHRIGVWSLYRNGNPDEGSKEYLECLVRTMKTAVHEIGHMLGLNHCIAYQCVMNGSNNRAESDRRPITLCPECMGKICWSCDITPRERYRRLIAFCKKYKFDELALFYAESMKRLKQ